MSFIHTPRSTGVHVMDRGRARKSPAIPSTPRVKAVLFAFLGLGAADPVHPQQSPLAAPPLPRAATEAPLPEGPAESFLALSQSGSFALEFSGDGWYAVDPEAASDLAGFDLAVYHRGGGAWVKGRLARRSDRGVEGALIDEATHAKYLIDFEPEDVDIQLSTETYRGSALYCGRLRQGKARKACSLVAVALHGRRMVRLHSLIDATTPRARQRLLAEVESAFANLHLLAPTGPGAD
ncbi:MAG: hypothetical protein NZ990_19115 [Myxococcota bacterium]|nr:hypothetical protein [Myxococcota bacterium]